MAISFHNQDIVFRLKDKLKIKAWIKRIIELEKKMPGQVNFVFTSDDALLETNRKFLDHDTFTDVITFDSCEGNTMHGDILISIERVKENARKFEVSFETELRRVMIHGVLHLCGYKDKSRKDAELIRKKEDAALRRF